MLGLHARGTKARSNTRSGLVERRARNALPGLGDFFKEGDDVTIRRLVMVLGIMSLGWGDGAWAQGAATPRPPLAPPQRMPSVLYVGNVSQTR